MAERPSDNQTPDRVSTTEKIAIEESKPTLILDDEVPAVDVTEEPILLVIEKIHLYAKISNPESRAISVLDKALLSGAVHYPGSGNLNDESNMLLFGHSSHLPNIRNQNFKIFNRISELNLGDEIRVESNKTAYIYKVTSVALVEADEALVEFRRGRKMITLSTCNTFGAKQERFVVEAVFLKTLPLPA